MQTAKQLDLFDGLHFAGTDFLLNTSEISAQLRADLITCGDSGDAEPAVNYVLENYSITGNPTDCRKYLEQYGCWDAAELDNHADNLARLVWIVGGDLAERGEAYFSTY